MKKLFLFKAVGSYFGGAAGATADTETEAFEKIRSKFGPSEYDSNFKLLTEKYVEKNSVFDDGVFQSYDGDWGFVHFLTAFSDKDVLFCETHEG